MKPTPLRPVLRGMLLTGEGERFLRAPGTGDALSPQPLWWPPTKIAGRFLSPYLAARDAEAVSSHPPGSVVEVDVRDAGGAATVNGG